MAPIPVDFKQLTSQPNAPTALPTPKPGFMDRVGGFIKGAAQGVGKLPFQIGAQIGNIGLGAADTFGMLSPEQHANLQNIQQNGMDNTPFGHVNVPTVNVMESPFSPQNTKAIKQSVGEGVQIGTMLGAGSVPQGTGILGGALSGAESGAIAGGGQGAGSSLDSNLGLKDTLMNTAGGALAGGAVGGLIGGVTGGFKAKYGPAGDLNTDHPIFKSNSYDENLAGATKANMEAGTEATNSIYEASDKINDMVTGARNQYAQVPKMISEADPNAMVTYSKETVDAMNKLADTKAWSLPDFIREPGLPSDIGNIGSGEITVSPEQAQDVATQLNDLKFNSKGDVVVNQQTSNLVNQVKAENQAALGHVIDAQGNSVWARMTQDYQQVMDAKDALAKLIPIKRFQGEILDPTEVNGSVNKMMKMMDTPQGVAAVARSNAEINAATGYDILNDPMGSMQKLIDSNADVEEAVKGGFGHQFTQGLKNPTALSRRTLMLSASIVTGLLGIVALSSLFRKKVASMMSGQ